MVGECPEGARNDGADDGEGAEARGAFPRLLVVEVESGECCSRAAAGVRREGEKRAAGSRKVPDRGCASLSQSDLVPVAIVAGWRRDLFLLLTDTHNKRGLSVDHGGVDAETAEFRVQEVMRSELGA